MSRSMKFGYFSNGFTLVELMITIAIAMITLSITVPSFTRIIESNRVKSTQDLLSSAIQRAQQEAIRSGRSGYLCPTSDGNSCSAAWGAGLGWLIFIDQNRDGVYGVATDTLVSVRTDIAAREIEGSSASVRFFPSGHTSVANYNICSDSSNVDDRRLTVNRVGRVEYVASASHCS